MQVREFSAGLLHHLQQMLGISLCQAAQEWVRSGCVSEVRIMQGGSTVTGIATGGAPGGPQTRHRVYIQYRTVHPGEAPAMEAECSCGEGSPCVHIAAISLAAAGANAATVNSSQAHNQTLSRRPALTANRGAPTMPQQVFYLLATRAATGSVSSDGIELSIWVGQPGAGGKGIQPESACVFVPRSFAGHGEFPRYVTAMDRTLLKALVAEHSDAPWELQGAAGAELLRQIVATDRAYWLSLRGQALRPGTTRPASCAWDTLPNGNQRLRCVSAAPVEVIASVEPAIYIDVAANECGALALPYSPDLLRQYWQEPPIAPERVDSVNQNISQRADGATFPRLNAIPVQRQPRYRVQPRLVLSAGPEATLQFRYNGLLIDDRSGRDTVRAMSNGVLHEMDRDHDTERHMQAQLAQLLGAPPWSRRNWLTFMADAVPALLAQGWEIVTEDAFPYRLAAAGDWYGTVDTSATRNTRSGAAREWFDLRLGIRVDERPVNLLPVLTAFLQDTLSHDTPEYCLAGANLFVKLEDERYVQVALERIERIAATLVELFDQDSLNAHHALSLPRCQLGRLAQLTEAADGPALQSQDAFLASQIADLKNFSAIEPMAAPPGFAATLRPYQQEGLGWLQFLRRHGLAGILADDMGLGKTAQTLAHLALEKAQGRLDKPALIVAPVSVIGNWQQEIRRFTPELKVLTLHGARRHELFAAIERSDVVITGYPLLQIDSEILLARTFSFVILDEAQMIKNPRAKVSQMARSLRADHRLCLTGTPLENHLGELWSLFEFLQPGLLGDERQFQRHYRTPIEKQGDTRRASALARRIAPFVLRRTKDAVATELPPKTQIVESIVLDERQRDLYDSIRLSMHRKVREIIQQQGLARSHLTVLDALLKLRQACCDPRLLPDADAQAQEIPSAKLEWLTTVLPELVAEGRRVLLFSQFTSMLRLIETAVTGLSIPYCLLTGSTVDRTAQVERFQSGAAPLFLISLKAGGTGLNLTAADTVIHYDPWWNPAVEAQATDRAHRIGQDKPVFVYKLIAQDTVEEKIMQMQTGKQTLASQLYADKTATPTQMTAADVEALFAP
jgi:superfamily II DNA or RNA helicase